jgi:hypothetical protein
MLPQYREKILLSKPRSLQVLTLQVLAGQACFHMENNVVIFSTSLPATFASPAHDDTSNKGDVFYGVSYVITKVSFIVCSQQKRARLADVLLDCVRQVSFGLIIMIDIYYYNAH